MVRSAGVCRFDIGEYGLSGLNPCQLPAFQFAPLHCKPGKTWRSALARTGDATGIEPAHAPNEFVARRVGVTMQDIANTGWQTARGNMREKKMHPLTLQFQGHGPARVTVAVAQDDAQRRTQLLELGERRRIAHIAEMPDLIRPAQPPRQRRRVAVMGIGKNRDAHRR